MNAPEHEEQEAAPLADPGSAVRLRGDPPRVMRLSRKAIGIASACGFALVGGALIYALQPQGRKGAEELYNTNGVAVADGLSSAPKDYGQVPKLGPPLPGDLGRPILDAQRRGDMAAMPPVGGPQSAAPNPAVSAAEAARQRAEQEREAAVAFSSAEGFREMQERALPACQHPLKVLPLLPQPRLGPMRRGDGHFWSAPAISALYRPSDCPD
jgi:type IV secretion system protein TrbI